MRSAAVKALLVCALAFALAGGFARTGLAGGPAVPAEPAGGEQTAGPGAGPAEPSGGAPSTPVSENASGQAQGSPQDVPAPARATAVEPSESASRDAASEALESAPAAEVSASGVEPTDQDDLGASPGPATAASEAAPADANGGSGPQPVSSTPGGNGPDSTPGDPGAAAPDGGGPSAAAGDGPAAPADATAALETAEAPAPVADQSATITQSAEADAATTQDDPSNTRIAVRVDEPGSGPGVSQRNSSTSSADALVSGDLASSRDGADTGNGTTAAAAPAEPASADPGQSTRARAQADQSARAGADAEQRSPSNLNIAIRIASPGDDGAVEQLNEARAAATARVTGPDAAGEVAGPAGNDPAVTTESETATQTERPVATATARAKQLDPANTNVAVRIGSPGSDGPLTQSNVATATASTNVSGPDGGEDPAATAEQTGATNTSVVIRVASPGTSQAADQSSTSSTGTSSTGFAPTVGIEETGTDTYVVVDVLGRQIELPTGNGTASNWRWSWEWDGKDSPGEPGSWDWRWSDSPDGESTAALDAVAGSLVWRWSWSRPDGSEPLGWTRQIRLDCTTCAWVWDWDWDWAWTEEPEAAADGAVAGDEEPVGSATAAAGDTAGVRQATSADATATSTASASVSQAIEQPGDDGLPFGGQIVSVVQIVEAGATAEQVAARNEWFDLDVADQAIDVVAIATSSATATTVQAIRQKPADGEAWAGQQIDVAQSSDAGSEALQTGRSTTGDEETASATAEATADARVEAEQRIDQGAEVWAAQWAGQLVQAGQIARGRARVVQQEGATAQAREATAETNVADVAIASQSVTQIAAEAADGVQTFRQSFLSLQTAVATADTTAGPTAPGKATSIATASNRALGIQTGLQLQLAGAAQDSTQEILIAQDGTAGSTSLGGVAGTGSVLNCASVGQSSTQSVGATLTGTEPGEATTYFCKPKPAPAPAPPSSDEPSPSADPGATSPSVEAEATAVGPESEAETTVVVTWWTSPLGSPPKTRRASTATSAGDPIETTPPFIAPVALPPTAAPPLGAAEAAPGSDQTSPVGRTGATGYQTSSQARQGLARLLPIEPEARETGDSPQSPAQQDASPTGGQPGSASPAGSSGTAAAIGSPVLGVDPPDGWVTWSEPAVRRPAFASGRLETPG